MSRRTGSVSELVGAGAGRRRAGSLDAAGCDVVLVQTVGVGQSEVTEQVETHRSWPARSGKLAVAVHGGKRDPFDAAAALLEAL